MSFPVGETATPYKSWGHGQQAQLQSVRQNMQMQTEYIFTKQGNGNIYRPRNEKNKKYPLLKQADV